MAAPILARKPDRSISAALKKARADGTIDLFELVNVLAAALDGNVVSDVEYRDLMRFLRTEQGLSALLRKGVEMFLEKFYPLEGPFVYPYNLDLLEGAKKLGNEECAALVQHSQPIGAAAAWRQGIPVRGNGLLIKKGTAVATFEDGFYPNRKHGNHVAYYISQGPTGIKVMDQWAAKDTVSSRTMLFKGRRADNLFVNPSDNGDALFVIMRKR